MIGALANPWFRRLWLAQVGLSLGDAVMQMGLVEYVRRAQLDVATETARMLFVAALPGVLWGPLAVLWLDRWPRRRTLLISDAVRLACVAALVWWTQPLDAAWRPVSALTGVLVMLFVIGTITAFYLPVRYAMIPNLVPTEQLVPANTALSISLAIANIGGRAAGGWIAETFGVTVALLANAVAYIASLFWIATLRPPAAPQAPSPVPRDRATVWEQWRDGWRYLLVHRTAMPLVVLAGVFALMLGVLIVTIVGYATDTLQLGTAGLGFLIGAAGLGAAGGVVLIGRGRPWSRSVWLPVVQLVMLAACLVALSFARDLPVVMLLMVLLGAIGATVMIPIDAKLQEEVEDARRGAVYAARGMLTSGLMLVAFWLRFGTPWLRQTPPPVVLQLCAIVMFGAAAWAAFILRRKQSQSIG
ncbi:MAG: MFS transporter [Verrucomicrobiae bacterium]|nr:MFS transporter [Verrucomicrobiae bacterium]